MAIESIERDFAFILPWSFAGQTAKGGNRGGLFNRLARVLLWFVSNSIIIFAVDINNDFLSFIPALIASGLSSIWMLNAFLHKPQVDVRRSSVLGKISGVLLGGIIGVGFTCPDLRFIGSVIAVLSYVILSLNKYILGFFRALCSSVAILIPVVLIAQAAFWPIFSKDFICGYPARLLTFGYIVILAALLIFNALVRRDNARLGLAKESRCRIAVDVVIIIACLAVLFFKSAIPIMIAFYMAGYLGICQ
jgi:hypothetical protein